MTFHAADGVNFVSIGFDQVVSISRYVPETDKLATYTGRDGSPPGTLISS